MTWCELCSSLIKVAISTGSFSSCRRSPLPCFFEEEAFPLFAPLDDNDVVLWSDRVLVSEKRRWTRFRRDGMVLWMRKQKSFSNAFRLWNYSCRICRRLMDTTDTVIIFSLRKEFPSKNQPLFPITDHIMNKAVEGPATDQLAIVRFIILIIGTDISWQCNHVLFVFIAIIILEILESFKVLYHGSKLLFITSHDN